MCVHVVTRIALQVVALVAGGDALQVGRGAGVHAQRRLEAVALEIFGVRGQQFGLEPGVGQQVGAKYFVQR